MRWGIVSAFVLLLLSLSFSANSTHWSSPSFKSCLNGVNDNYLSGSSDCTANCMEKSYGIHFITDMIRRSCLSNCVSSFPFSRIDAKVYDYNTCLLGCHNTYATTEFTQCSIDNNGEMLQTMYCYTKTPSAKSLSTCLTGCQDDLGISKASMNWYETAQVACAKRLVPKAAKRIVVLDPGHGERYTGAHGADGEAEVVAAIAAKLKPLLEADGYQVNITPSNYTADARANFADGLGADILVSIHTNGAGDPGVEAFYGENNYGEAGGSKEADMELCDSIYPPVVDILPSEGRTIKSDTKTNATSLGVLRYSNMPACLVEMEFIGYVPEDPITFEGNEYSTYSDLMNSEDYQNAAAEALRQGIKDYFGSN
ncbi:MAG: N-acetylmuramoyl-L-alanine amidase [Candidatus ainarchaeum sp.]|nr:N-acetylmuramoyl-L-alanine amidase [Candidatus ainarchaeum sp.]